MEEEKVEFKPLEVSERQYKKDHKKDKKANDPVEGRAIKKWSTFFFVMSVISTVLVVSSFALPVIIVLFGLMSALIWICWLAIGTIFTLGMMWMSDDVKKFNQGWMDFNNRIFDAGNAASEFGTNIVTGVVVAGAAFFVITWIFMVVGINTDEVRKRHYKGMIIALSIITFFFVLLALFAIIFVYSQKYGS